METIKMVDLHGQYLRIKDEIDLAIQEVLSAANFIQGNQVSEFAQALAKYTGSPFVIPCANGTDALQIAMMALGLQPGDEVILPVHTYVATAEVVALLKLTPVFADVHYDTFNLDCEKLEGLITPRTKVIVPVHLYGQCVEMEKLLSIAKKNDLFVIEDAAQAIGAVYSFGDGRKMQAGTMGDVGTTSFFPSKNLGCFGDGGAIFTASAPLAEVLQMVANHGQRIKYHHDVIGVNSRLDTLQAAILIVKLAFLDEYCKKRNQVAAFYDQHLADLPEVLIPVRSRNSTHAFHQYTIKVKDQWRDQLKEHLKKQQIPTMIYYPVPLHFQKAYYKSGVDMGSFPVSEQLSKEVLSLPIHTEMTDDQLHHIVSQITQFFK